MDRATTLRLHYDAIAKDYASVNQGIERLLARINLIQDQSVLDIGCGTGNLTLRLSEAGQPCRIVGVDISEGVLEVARQQAAKGGSANCEFVKGNACCLPFGDGEFDLVVSNMVFHLLPDLSAGLAEVLRVLKPSGRMIIQMQGGGDVGGGYTAVFRKAWKEILPAQEPPQLVTGMTVEEVARHFGAVGIKDFDIQWSHAERKLPIEAVAKMLEMSRFVLGFWRSKLDTATADRIDERISQLVTEKAAKDGYCPAIGNVLLLEAAKP